MRFFHTALKETMATKQISFFTAAMMFHIQNLKKD